MTTTTKTIELPVSPDKYGDTDKWSSPDSFGRDDEEVILVVDGKRSHYGYVGPDGESRREYQGPILPGPYFYAFELCVVIDNHGGSGRTFAEAEAAGNVYYAEVGDTIEVRGERFTIAKAPSSWAPIRYEYEGDV